MMGKRWSRLSKNELVEDKSTTRNLMALNVIQYGVDSKHIRLITTVELTKEGYDTLQVIYEGSRKGKTRSVNYF